MRTPVFRHGPFTLYFGRLKIGRCCQQRVDEETVMMLYYRGVAIHPSVGRNGHLFVSHVAILEEDGEETSLGGLGYFSNRESALQFAVRCGTAFIDREPLPRPPCHLQLVTEEISEA
jgi:hypothetical protein